MLECCMHLEKDQHRRSFTIVSAFRLRNGPVLGTTAAPPLKTGVKLCMASKYPPAEPGALGREPLKAAIWGR
jgi:hypothetical protein